MIATTAIDNPGMHKSWLAVLVLTLGVAGCEGSSSSPDAGRDTPDGHVIDGGSGIVPDARPQSGPLTITVFGDDGLPIQGADVVVQRFDSFDAPLRTDATGTASPMVMSGDTLTAAFSFQSKGSERRIMTWVGVEPGDVLHMGDPRRVGAVIGTMTVSPPDSFAGAVRYQATSGCFDATSQVEPVPLAYDLHAGCHRDAAKIPVWLQAFDGNNQSIAYATQAQTPLESMAASATFATWRTDAQPFSSTISHLPASAPGVARHLALLAPGGELFEIGLASPPGTPGSATARVPLELAPTWIYADQLIDSGSVSRWRVVGGTTPVPASVSLDYATGLLATVSPPQYDASDVARFFCSWTYGGDGSIHTSAVLVSHHLAQDGFTTWTLLLPAGSTSIRLPQLPDSMAAFRPTALPSDTRIVVIDSNNADYRQIRRVISGAATDGEQLWPVATSPLGSGNVRLSERVFFSGP